ncbi:MAG: hypothetical protein ABI689_11775 [Thermoanaerobaculia bacterium]
MSIPVRAVLVAGLALWMAHSTTASGEVAASPEQVTLARMRLLAGALLSRQSDETSGSNWMLAPVSDFVLAGQPSELVRMPPRSALRRHSQVVELLHPSDDFYYLCEVYERDGWGGRIEVYFQEENILSAKAVTVRSPGANGRIDADRYEIGGFLPGAATDDLVFSGKGFVRWPLGTPAADLVVKPEGDRCAAEAVGSDPAEGPAPTRLKLPAQSTPFAQAH